MLFRLRTFVIIKGNGVIGVKISHEVSSIDMIVRNGEWQKGLLYLHWHEKLEIVQCLDKGFGVLIDGVRYEVKKGDLIVVGEQIVHSFDVYQDSTKYRLGQFPFEILLNNGVIPEPVKPVITKEELESVPNLESYVNNILDMIQNEGAVERGQKNPIVQNLYATLYFYLLKCFPAEECTYATKKEKNEFYKIIKYANENYTQDINIQTIARSLYMDRGRISALFSKYTGMRLNQYINMLRVSHANEMLEKGAGVTETALESGFQSVRTFSSVYKKIMGTTPGKKNK